MLPILESRSGGHETCTRATFLQPDGPREDGSKPSLYTEHRVDLKSKRLVEYFLIVFSFMVSLNLVAHNAVHQEQDHQTRTSTTMRTTVFV
jgi:hypothetical protein